MGFVGCLWRRLRVIEGLSRVPNRPVQRLRGRGFAQRSQYPSFKEYTLNYRGLNIMV